MYRINRFSKLTGLSTHCIRAWERRYGLVNPARGANRYRLYTDDDVHLFRYLKGKVDQGMSIGELAEAGREALLKQAQKELILVPVNAPTSEHLVSDLAQALLDNDRTGFERKLNGALAVIPFEEALHRFLLPLQTHVGQLWHDGKLGVAQEHFGSNQVKQKIFSAINQMRLVEEGPRVVVACPAHEWHEIAAMTAAYLCAARGCRVHYLGANLPIPELGTYCERVRPSYVLLSMTVDRTASELNQIVEEIVTLVKPITPIGIGGRFAQINVGIFSDQQITVFPNLQALDTFVLSLVP